MVTNKNQHFVPRCHLKPFSRNEEGRCINVFNIDRMKLILWATVKSQCSGNYFYGDDAHLENAIQATETAYGGVLSSLYNQHHRPTQDQKQVLKICWFLQYMRTEAAARRSVDMLEGMKEVFELDPEEFRMGIKEAVQQAMRIFGAELHLVEDMNVAFGRNVTGKPLLTSDDPAILLNRWHQADPACKGKSFGLISAGNIMLLPLSPSLVFIGYDSGVYSVPKKKGWFTINREMDISALNQIQALNCHANLYVPAECSESALREMVEKVKAKRPEVSHRTHYAVKSGTCGDSTRYRVVSRSELNEHDDVLLHVQPIHPVIDAWPSIIKWRSKGAVYSDGSAVGYVRSDVTERKKDRKFKKHILRKGRIQE